MTANLTLFQAMTNVAAAHLANPNTRIDTADLKGFLKGLYDDMSQIMAAPPSVPAVGGAGLDAPVLPAPMRAGLPVPVAAPAPMSDAARASLSGATAQVGGEMGEPGEHLLPRVWQGVPRETQQKFRNIIREYNITIGPDGYPVPRRPMDKLISETRMQVADPITGDYHTMLRRHLRLAHGLEHEELLAMFNFTEAQMPCTGPAYSESKAEQARRTRLGHRTPAPEPVEEAVQARAPGRKRKRVDAAA